MILEGEHSFDFGEGACFGVTYCGNVDLMETLIIEESAIGEAVTVDEIRAKIVSFEGRFGLTTERFLMRYSDGLDDLDDVPEVEAEEWFSLAHFRERLLSESRSPFMWLDSFVEEEAPKGASSLYRLV